MTLVLPITIINSFIMVAFSVSPKSIAVYEPPKHDDEVTSNGYSEYYELVCIILMRCIATLNQGSWVSSPKDSVFPETIPEEASSVEEERVVIFRLPSTSFKPSVYTVCIYLAGIHRFYVNTNGL